MLEKRTYIDQKLVNEFLDKLIKCHRADEINDLLVEYENKLPFVWKPIGNNEANVATINNQSSDPIKSATEIPINSVDSEGILQCLINKIDPESFDAPKSTKDVAKEFFNIPDGELFKEDTARMREIAENFGGLVLTGDSSKYNSRPTIAFWDYSEGRPPEEFHNFIDLNGSNKDKIRFTQGKFGQGSQGVASFCKNGLQLIISRKNPQLKNDFSDDISFTITKLFPPKHGEKRSVYRYLTIDNDFFRVKARPLRILPTKNESNPFSKNWEFGTFRKCFDYQINIQGSARGNAHIAVEFDRLIPDSNIPFMILDRRNNTFNDGDNRYFVGLKNRLLRDALLSGDKRVTEEECPITIEIHIDGQHIPVQIFALKHGVGEQYWQGKQNGVFFIHNGQTHHMEHKRFYRTKDLKLGILDSRLITFIDTSHLDNKIINEIYMSNREKLRNTEFMKKVIDEVKLQISQSEQIKTILQRHRINRMEEQNNKNDETINDTVSKLIRQNPYLANILIKGNKITNPTGPIIGGKKDFIPNFPPSFFKLKSNRSRNVELGKKIRFKLLTDAPNDYFQNTKYKGKIEVFIDSKNFSDYSVRMHNGVCNIELKNLNSVLDKSHVVMFRVTDSDEYYGYNKESNTVDIKVVPSTSHNNKNSNSDKDTNGKSGKEGKKALQGNLPMNEIRMYKNDVDYSKYFSEKNDTLSIQRYEESYDVIYNMDNKYLVEENKNNVDKKESNENDWVNYLRLSTIAFIIEDRQDGEKEAEKIEEFCEAKNTESVIILPRIKYIRNSENN